jgi:hypothetical protein
MAKEQLRPQEDYFHDDPVKPAVKRKNYRSLSSAVMLIVAGLFINNTLAANISLTSGGGVEFGQGISMTTACSGSQTLTVTPQAQFVNSTGAGSYYFKSVRVSGIPSSCNGSDFTINAYGVSGNSPTALFNSSSTNAVVYNNSGGAFQLGYGTTNGASITSSTGTFTLTFAEPVALSESVVTITIQSSSHTALPCVQGGDCVIGEVGPGGGRIFYYAAAGFNCGTGYTNTGSPAGGLCHYLEAAPTFGGGGRDAQALWAVSAYQNTDVASITNEASVNNTSSGIGLGYKNSIAIVAQNGAGSTYAAGAARAYTGGSKTDWYLPTSAELNQMCKWARNLPWISDATVCTSAGTLNTGPGAAGFDQNNYDYWSSSEYGSGYSFLQYFGDGGQGAQNKNLIKNMRPIRAF